ncbi:MAG: hypothetical protein BBJ57_04560 [Desulfobacterales bacterium PC51MH44]|nr:MAG: hypothetical protein BBJ57_04560 [Desulfobacterales bacterium PC51MH44]
MMVSIASSSSSVKIYSLMESANDRRASFSSSPCEETVKSRHNITIFCVFSGELYIIFFYRKARKGTQRLKGNGK